MAIPNLEPIRDNDIEEFCEFLNENLNASIAPDDWAQSFRVPWMDNKPNNGFLIRDNDGRIVGGIGAIYSRQLIRGQEELFCNITSWCVVEAYRSQSMRLAMSVVSQKGYHFTDLTPTSVVAGSLQFLKFKPLDSDRTVIFNIPTIPFHSDRIEIIRDYDKIVEVLPDKISRIFLDHRGFPWLNFIAIGRHSAFCLLIFKRSELKKLPSASIIYVSDAALFLRYYRILGNYLLLRFNMVTTLVESRFLPEQPRFSVKLSGYRQKMYRSETLNDSDISNLYSELVCLNI